MVAKRIQNYPTGLEEAESHSSFISYNIILVSYLNVSGRSLLELCAESSVAMCWILDTGIVTESGPVLLLN